MVLPTAILASTEGGAALFRGLLRELQRSGAARGCPAAAHLADEFRRHQVTEKQHCKASEEMRHLAGTYGAYLRSQRMWSDVHAEYHSKGERSVRDTAKIVGFKLPHDPK